MKIILASGPARSRDAIVIDHRAQCFWRDGKCVRIGAWSMFRFISAVLVAYPNHIPVSEMVEHIWGDDIGGGPCSAAESLRTRVTQHRQSILALGIDIRSSYSSGWRAYAPDEKKLIPPKLYPTKGARNDCAARTSDTAERGLHARVA